MICDTQEQKTLLLQIFNSVNFPAAAIEQMYEFKKALESAEIKEKEKQAQATEL